MFFPDKELNHYSVNFLKIILDTGLRVTSLFYKQVLFYWRKYELHVIEWIRQSTKKNWEKNHNIHYCQFCHLIMFACQ